MGYLPEAVGLRFSYQWMSRQELLLCGIIQPRLLMYTPNPVNLNSVCLALVYFIIVAYDP